MWSSQDYSGIHERHRLLRQDLPLHHLKKIYLWEKYFFLFGFFCWEDVTYENFFSGKISYFLTSIYLCYPTKVGQEWDKMWFPIKKDLAEML